MSEKNNLELNTFVPDGRWNLDENTPSQIGMGGEGGLSEVMRPKYISSSEGTIL